MARSLVAVVPLLVGCVICQSLITDISNETSLVERDGFGPAFTVDTSQNGVCSSILPAGGIKSGNIIWANQGVDLAMIQELTAFPVGSGATFIDGGWTHAFLQERASVVPDQAVDCRRTDTFCTVRKTCADYKSVPFLLAAISIENIHRSLSAQINAYDRVIAQLDAGNQASIRALLRDMSFPNTRGFSFSAFLDGFLLGVDLIGGISETLLKSIGTAIKEGIEAAIDSAIQPAIDAKLDIFTDASPVVNGLRDVQNSLKAGSFLEPLPSDEEMISTAAADIFKQTKARLLAGLWMSQDVEIIISEPVFCDRSKGTAGGGNCATNGCSEIRFLGNVNGKSLCLEVGAGKDLPQALVFGELQKFGLNIQDISQNAAACNDAGGSGIFPPADSDILEFGFPRCTFPFKKLENRQ
ncbi:hypothetical protein T069G_08950 [Trichoderma breve]|uniref:Uncharacterized protein n=1 Tax=Trichoderma breve TaxID=2034170 RepID=A0A9W9B3W1_9HYPO|nr:hypothetical protein T069G_08950 [Trichoderma breve]KAJ4855582.1 hypothetical protein T069G_08950 [Trichoderma breve]